VICLFKAVFDSLLRYYCEVEEDMGMLLRMKDEAADELLELPDFSRLSVNRIKAFSISNSLFID